MAKVYNRSFLSLKQTFKTNCLCVHWTDFHLILTV